MEWLDEGLLLRIHPHGESNVIATFFTQYHGLATGYLRTNKKYPLQPGNLYHIKYKARLTTHLGLFTVEQDETFVPLICAALGSPIKLACINSIRTLLIASLIDHDPDQNFYTQLKNYIHEICLQNNIGGYVLFEKDLLACCGFGLDLRRCAITNSVKNLAYVSPKTGRAVIEVVGAPYKTQLFKLPVQLYNSDIITWTHEDVLEGLKMTGYFLDQMFQNHLHRIVPSERDFVVKLVHKTKKDNYVS